MPHGQLRARGVRRPDVEVLATVAGRGVHEAGAGVVGDMVAVEQRHGEIVALAAAQRVSSNDASQSSRSQLGTNCSNAVDLRLPALRRLQASRAEHKKIARLRPIVLRALCSPRRVRTSILRRRSDRAIAGNRPRRRRPDDDRRAHCKILNFVCGAAVHSAMGQGLDATRVHRGERPETSPTPCRW